MSKEALTNVYNEIMQELQRSTELEDSAWRIAHEMRVKRVAVENRARQSAFDLGAITAKEDAEAAAAEAAKDITEDKPPKKKGKETVN